MTIWRSTSAMLLGIFLAEQAVSQVQEAEPIAMTWDDAPSVVPDDVLEALDGHAEGLSSVPTETQYVGILLDLTQYRLDQEPGRARLLWHERGIFRLSPNMQIGSTVMFSRAHPFNSYGLGVRDRTATDLDRGKLYPLTVPLPVPAKLFWGVTAYEPYTPSELQGKALGALFELTDHERQWIDTLPGTGLLLYFSLHGSEDLQKPGGSRAIDQTD